jgi:hypothetical protein
MCLYTRCSLGGLLCLFRYPFASRRSTARWLHVHVSEETTTVYVESHAWFQGRSKQHTPPLRLRSNFHGTCWRAQTEEQVHLQTASLDIEETPTTASSNTLGAAWNGLADLPHSVYINVELSILNRDWSVSLEIMILYVRHEWKDFQSGGMRQQELKTKSTSKLTIYT